MKLSIDTNEKTLRYQQEDKIVTLALYSKNAFEIISQLWLKVGWNEKYSYTFSWMGRPVIQLPEDMFRIQEVIYRVRPDVIIETGIAHGGSLIYYASLCKAMDKGRVIGVDIEIRPQNRKAIEEHFLYPMITLIEGNSVAPDVVNQVKSCIKPGEIVLVILDSLHTKEHVLAELEAYHDLVAAGSYIVATDGIMRLVADAPRGDADWYENNPSSAAIDFARKHPNFTNEQPGWLFNESNLGENITHWPNGYLRRIK